MTVTCGLGIEKQAYGFLSLMILCVSFFSIYKAGIVFIIDDSTGIRLVRPMIVLLQLVQRLFKFNSYVVVQRGGFYHG